jgi:hypothetical protein
MFTPTKEDIESIDRLKREAGKEPVWIRCFSKSEAYWLRDSLLSVGVNVVKISWLEF